MRGTYIRNVWEVKWVNLSDELIICEGSMMTIRLMTFRQAYIQMPSFGTLSMNC